MQFVSLICKTLPPFPFAVCTMKGDDDALKCDARNSGKYEALLDSNEMEENGEEGDEFCIECEDQLAEIICVDCSNEVGGPLCEKASPSPF